MKDWIIKFGHTMRSTPLTGIMAIAFLGATLSSHAEFENLWTLGIDNDDQSEFA